MTLKRCSNGHYFDQEKYSSCPNCGVRNLNMDTTRPVSDRGFESDDKPTARASQDDSTRRINEQRPERDPGATQAVWKKKTGIDPVVGWLVCIQGPDKGRDYRIRNERNGIGRDPSMQICISGDETISREKHAIISFNPKKSSFLLMPGEGRGLVYLNNDEVATPTQLSPYDVIEIGQTKLAFIPFCGQRFQWDGE